MADEITLNTKLAMNNGFRLDHIVNTSITQTTAGGVQRRQTITTSDTVITLTGVTTPRAISIKNVDATNFIDIGPTVAGAIAPMVRLLAGEQCVMPLKPSVVLRAQADTASVILEMLILET